MKKIILAVLASISIAIPVQAQKQPQGVIHDFQITRVLDGDTVAFHAPFLPAPLKPELSLRIHSVDTPEKGFRAKCPLEDQRGQAATQFTKKAIETAKVRKVVIMAHDKYGGRLLGTIILDGRDLRDMLIAGGYAIPYFGEAKTHDWCKQ